MWYNSAAALCPDGYGGIGDLFKRRDELTMYVLPKMHDVASLTPPVDVIIILMSHRSFTPLLLQTSKHQKAHVPLRDQSFDRNHAYTKYVCICFRYVS